MKNKILVALGIVLVLVLAGLAGCSAPGPAAAGAKVTGSTAGGVNTSDTQPINVNVGSQQTGIWVNGQGKVTVTPDIASISLGVSAQSLKVSEAQSQAATAMDKVMSTLAGNGVDKKDIQTQNYNIQQVTRWDDKNQQEVLIGYRVSNTVVARLRDLDKAGNILDAAVAAGGDLIRVNGITFTVEKPEQYYTQVRELAMKDAKAKAQQIATLSGVTLGKPTYVSENSYIPPQPYPVAYKMDAAAGGVPTTPISAGETDITLSVQVTYAIQ